MLPSPNLYSQEKITIVYTNSLNGNLDYCHCKENPRGGLVKRATELKNIRKSFKNVFLFETGDIFTCEPDILLANYIIRGYKYLKYDSITFGDQEFSVGIEGFLNFRTELPFICNNILLKKDNRWRNYFTRFQIIEKNNIKIGVIGSISKGAFKYYSKSITERIRILDQIKEINRDIKKLKKAGVELIILLSHSGYEKDIELSKRLKGIDIIVGGHSQTLVKDPVRAGDCLVVQAGANGAHIGILELTLENGIIKTFKNMFRLPDEFQPEDDNHIRKLINEYNKNVENEANRIRFKR